LLLAVSKPEQFKGDCSYNCCGGDGT